MEWKNKRLIKPILNSIMTKDISQFRYKQNPKIWQVWRKEIAIKTNILIKENSPKRYRLADKKDITVNLWKNPLVISNSKM